MSDERKPLNDRDVDDALFGVAQVAIAADVGESHRKQLLACIQVLSQFRADANGLRARIIELEAAP